MYLIENERYRASLSSVLSRNNLSVLAGRSVLITGATGLLGSCLVDTLMLWNQGQAEPCKVAAASRNAGKARARFGCYWENDVFSFWQQDVCAPIQKFPEQCDYIIHAASNADPVNIAADPVNTLLANVIGTNYLLQYGQSHGMRRFLYVSSGEVYGQPEKNLNDFIEGYCGPLDLSNPRSSYPSGKRAAEVLCQSYVSQYAVDAVIVRPCHLFGPTMRQKDSRAVCEFLRSAAEQRDIILKSNRRLERSHCYAADAVGAVLLALIRGERGAVYNIADRRYQMTIREFAERAAAAGRSRVVFDPPSDLERKGYSTADRMVLDASRLEMLGWTPTEGCAIEQTIKILREIGGTSF